MPTIILRTGVGTYTERGVPAVFSVSSARPRSFRADPGKFAMSVRAAALKKRKRRGPGR